MIQNEKGIVIFSLKSDQRKEFENKSFENSCNKYEIKHNFSSLTTLQQNGVVEKNNRNLQEMIGTTICGNSLPNKFWAEAVDTSFYILNKCLIRPLLKRLLMSFGRIESLIIAIFACVVVCAIFLTQKTTLTNLIPNQINVFFLAIQLQVRHIGCTNKKSVVVEESMNVIFDKSNISFSLSKPIEMKEDNEVSLPLNKYNEESQEQMET